VSGAVPTSAFQHCAAVATFANLPFFVNGGHISKRQSAINALAQWANDNERRLCGLSCGDVLPRDRHRTWAEQVIADCRFLMQVGDNFGVVVLPRNRP
jgi:hypothetical protein